MIDESKNMDQIEINVVIERRCFIPLVFSHVDFDILSNKFMGISIFFPGLPLG